MDRNVGRRRGEGIKAAYHGEKAFTVTVHPQNWFPCPGIEMSKAFFAGHHHDGFDLPGLQEGIEAPLKDWFSFQQGGHLVETHAVALACRDNDGGATHVTREFTFRGKISIWWDDQSVSSGELLHDRLGEAFAVGTTGGTFLEDLHDLAHVSPGGGTGLFDGGDHQFINLFR